MTSAQALLAVGYLAEHDSDAIAYHWPPLPLAERSEGIRLHEHAVEAFKAADARGAEFDDWAAVVNWCEAADIPDVERLP